MNLAFIRPNTDSKELFARLSHEAEDGKLVGAIVVSMYDQARSRKKYSLSMSGWAAHNPTLAAGAMSSCQVLVQELALQDAGLL